MQSCIASPSLASSIHTLDRVSKLKHTACRVRVARCMRLNIASFQLPSATQRQRDCATFAQRQPMTGAFLLVMYAQFHACRVMENNSTHTYARSPDDDDDASLRSKLPIMPVRQRARKLRVVLRRIDFSGVTRA